MKRTNATAYNSRVTIQKASITKQDTGAELQTWADVVKRWVGIQPLQGRTLYAAQQAASEVTVNIRMLYDGFSKTLNPREYRIVRNGVIYDILNIINDADENRELVFMCKTVNNP